MSARDFFLTDNGVPQQVDVVARASTAVDAILALDVSTSVRGEKLAALRQAAHRFVDSLWPTDSVTLLEFGSELRVDARPGTALPDVHAAIERLEGGGATLLVDAAYAALLLTDRRAAAARREDPFSAAIARLCLARFESSPEAAGAAYRSALEIDPGLSPAWLGLSQSMHASGDRPGALAALERLLSLGDTCALSAWVHYHLGRGRAFPGALAALRARLTPPR